MLIPEADRLAAWLDEKSALFNRPEFIQNDPISIPHRFTQLQDIEISAFFAAVLAWGQRKTIINKCNELIAAMDNAPFAFITQHSTADLTRFLKFKHRTFNATDTLYFIEFFRQYYARHTSLETAFAQFITPNDPHCGKALAGFYGLFFSLQDAPLRTRKHISTPDKQSACKRMNMFLRWMVRRDNQGVDFGLWQHITPAQLLIPLDVHVERVARKLQLLKREKPDWYAVLELTDRLRTFDPNDPVKYDFALFGAGVLEKNAKPF